MGKDLAAPNIPVVYQDSKGNMWISTYPGVCMFDGINYYLFSEQNGFGSVNVKSIIEDYDGNMWFSTERKGVYCFTGEELLLYTAKQGLCHNFISLIDIDPEGNIWFFSSWKGFSCFDGESFTNYISVEAFYGKNFSASLTDKNGNMWLGTKFYGVEMFDGKSITNYFNHGHYFGTRINDIYEDSNGLLWFSTEKGISSFDGEYITEYSEDQGLFGEQGEFWEDEKGNLWFSSKGYGLTKFNGESFTKVYVEDDLNSNIALDIQKDNNGKIWIGTSGDGMKCFTPESFMSYSSEEGLPIQFVNSIYEDDSGNLWFGTTDGYSVYNGTTYKNYKPLSSFGEFSVLDIFQDSKGNMWLSAHGRGIARLDNDKLSFYLMESGLNNNNVADIAEDSEGTLWLATDNGLNSISGNVVKSFFKWDGLEYFTTTSVSIDSNDLVWFGTYYGLFFFDGSTLKNYTESDGLISNEVKSILHDSEGKLWVCTGKGLSCYTNGEFINFDSKNGLVYDDATSVCEDTVGNFWIGTRNGLSYLRFDTTDVNTGDIPQYMNGKRAYFYNFGVADGIKNLSFFWGSVLRDSKNRIWWGGNKYLTMLDLNSFQFAYSEPEVSLVNLVVNDEHVDYRSLSGTEAKHYKYTGVSDFYNIPSGLELPYYKNHLKFNFSALDLNSPNSVRFMYVLEGYDKGWSKLRSDCFAEYRNIPSGKYTFKVKAVGASKKLSNIVEYSFEIHPPWWKEWWAYFLYVVVLVISVWFFIYWRTERLKKYSTLLEHKVEERTKVITLQKGELEQQNEEILAINESLKDQRKIVEDRNQELNSQNEEMQTQRDMLNRQNKDITASIAYAERIQKAVFPHEYYIDELIPENFILFKPKDIVSGDFYWVKQVNNKIVIAAADCTGHGVPGAIMSMLGISILNNIVFKREITEANVILNELRREVKRSLHQSSKSNESRDGMDIALCVIDPKNNTMQYSGAHNPVYIIRGGELTEIKADKMPIGVFMNDVNTFTNHEIDLKIGDVLYVFSDGFHDQLGGKNDTKYMKKYFKEFLLKIHKKPMSVQKQMLDEEHIKWMGKFDQTDDILVMGVRVL